MTLRIDYSAVTVPAGTFSPTVCVEEVVTGTYNLYPFTIEAQTWYAKEVGEIKSTYTMTFDAFGVLGEETRVLKSYSLN
jgi:hypothetical protein